MTSEHTSLEKYTSHFIRKGCESVLCERWVGDWTKTATYWPPALLLIAALLSHFAGLLNRGGVTEGRKPSVWKLVLSTASYLQLQQLTPNSKLTRTSCGTGLYNCFTFACFSERHICTQFNPSTVKVIPWYLRPDAPVIYTGAFLIWQLGRVGGQYVTLPLECFFFLESKVDSHF